MVKNLSSDIKKARSLFSYFFVVFIDNFGFSIVFVMFAPLFLDPSFNMVSADTGQVAKNVLLGVSFVAFPLLQLFGAPILGDIADSMGRKKALYISISGLCFGFIISALSIQFHMISLLVLSRCISGFFAGNLAISLAGIADLSSNEKQRGRNFGYVAAIMGIGWILSMIFSGVFTNTNLVGVNGPIIVFWVCAGLTLLNFMVVVFCLSETLKVNTKVSRIHILAGLKNIKIAFNIKSLKRLYVIYFLWIIGWGSGVQWIQAYTMENFQISQSYFVLFMVIFGFTWSCGSSFINAFFLKFVSSNTLAKIGLFTIGVLVFSQGFLYQFLLFSLIFYLAAIFSSLTMSNILNLISLQADENIQGRVMGLSQSVQAIGWITGCLISIIIFASSSIVFYPILGILLIISALLLTTATKSSKS